MHVYEVRRRKDKRGFDLISDVLPFGRLWYGEPNAVSNAIGYAEFYNRSHDAQHMESNKWQNRNGTVHSYLVILSVGFITKPKLKALP